jgi:sugar lactone lactonase YvrE
VFTCDNIANTIRRLDLVTGQVTTFAGTKFSAGYSDGIAALASFNGPTSITNDGTYLYVADYNNHTIRRIEISTANVTTIAGLHSVQGDADQTDPPGGIASDARFRFPFGITTDGTSVFITERSNHKIRKIDIATGSVSTFAGPAPGSRTSGYINATGNTARFRFPRCITTDGTNLYVADGSNHVIRRINIATAVVDTIAGPDAPYVKAGEVDGTGTGAKFNGPYGITTDGTSLYVSDTGGNTIRRIR